MVQNDWPSLAGAPQFGQGLKSSLPSSWKRARSHVYVEDFTEGSKEPALAVSAGRSETTDCYETVVVQPGT